jgi:Predicted phosphoesterase
MDKIAIISDIHGNMPALNAVISDISSKNIKRIFCLGDIAGKGPSTKSVLEKIREICEVVIKGNWEYLIIEKPACDIFKWHRDKLSEEQLDYIKNLPMYHEFNMSGRLVRLCHAAPFSVFHRVHSFAETREKLELFGGVAGKDCDVLGYGDIHGAYVQNMGYKTIFNCGSVGNPLDIPMASYAIIEGMEDSAELTSFSINIVKIPYDIEKAVLEARDSDMPEEEIEQYVNELRTSKYRGRKD